MPRPGGVGVGSLSGFLHDRIKRECEEPPMTQQQRSIVTGLNLGKIEAAAGDLLGMCSEAGYRDAVGILVAAVPSLLAAARAVQRIREVRGCLAAGTAGDDDEAFVDEVDTILAAALGTEQEGQQ